MRFNYDTVAVGQEVAIDSGRNYFKFEFGTVTRITKTQIEVTLKSGTITKFSKVTHKILGGNSWDSHNKLSTAVDAHAALERQAAQKARQTERHEIKTKLQQISVDGWSAETVTEVRALADRIQQYIGE
jgi:hypothetical protein